ncbi:MAG TPA: holo-ACP synthase [Syntrophorhabdaceae bacterium]|nr:holo-ACP synthase [Syntrophorhabdaceae bacterium]
MDVGVDIVDVKRIKKVLDKYGEKFLNKVFSDEEKPFLKQRKFLHESIAGRFAAKEAFIKAKGMKLPLKEIHVFQNTKKPYINYRGKVYKGLSISHERDYAVAVVIIHEDK